MTEARHAAAAFDIYGDYCKAERYGSGHINDTYRLWYSQAGVMVPYILQRINNNVFRQPEQVMENIRRVTGHLAGKMSHRLDLSRRTLTLLPTKSGAAYHTDNDGNVWRAYLFIDKARTYDVVENDAQVYEAAKAFGCFQKELADLPGGRLFETIKDFHNTPKRIEALEAAIAADVCGRVRDVATEIGFVRERIADAGLLVEMLRRGELPERIIHNDTKLNNVMLDDATGEGICVIDLDTVMPGLVHYDFGDMIRTGTSTSAEDERDLSKVSMRFEKYEAILRGYLAGAGAFLTDTELKYLPFSGKLITLEIGVRFLTDYLSGDVYFKTHRTGHNLDRCRTQFKLVVSIENQLDRMIGLLGEIICCKSQAAGCKKNTDIEL